MKPEPKKRTGPTTLFITFCGGSFPVFLLTKSFTYSKMNRSRTKSLKKNIFFFTRVRSQNKMKFILKKNKTNHKVVNIY